MMMPNINANIKILITAFEPFNQQTENASLDILNDLSFSANNIEIIKQVLPVTYNRNRYQQLIEEYRPNIILHLGEAGNRQKISLETKAINKMNAKIPDNLGIIKQGETIILDGPNEIHTNLPIEPIYQSLSDLGYPVEISHSAGEFICNQALYCSMYHVQKHHLPILVGFIHFPRLSHQTNTPNTPTIPLSIATLTLKRLIELLMQLKTSEKI